MRTKSNANRYKRGKSFTGKKLSGFKQANKANLREIPREEEQGIWYPNKTKDEPLPESV